MLIEKMINMEVKIYNILICLIYQFVNVLVVIFKSYIEVSKRIFIFVLRQIELHILNNKNKFCIYK